VGAVLDEPETTCEVICDGIHLHPVAARLVWRAKGPDGVVLVPDATAAAGMPDGTCPLGETEVLVRNRRATTPDGVTISGSTLTMAEAARHGVTTLSVDLVTVARLAATNDPWPVWLVTGVW
jgi:N-acetylglucosamine-6-phosphate deacetylase